MRKIMTTVAAMWLTLTFASAQTEAPASKWSALNHLDLSLTGGSPGVGLELQTPIAGEWARVRTGLSIMPRVEVPMHFGIQVGNDPTTSQSKFTRMAGLLESFTGKKVDSQIDMMGKPVLWNWSLVVDVFPLKRNRHWHVSAGFYLGPSRIARAYNTTEDMPSLMAVGIYNNIYNKLVGVERRDLPNVKLIDLSPLGENYQQFGSDPEMLLLLQQKFESTGRMGVHVGDFVEDMEYVNADGKTVSGKAGEPYIMEPDENGMVKADMRVQSLKPYVGFGYEGRLSKRAPHYRIGFDCGVMFWGGAPEVTTHEGIDLNHDVRDIGGKVGRYVDIIDKFKVFPVVNLRLTRTIF